MKLNLGGSAAPEGEGGTVELYSNARVFRTPSGTRQGKFHFTICNDLGDVMCTCEGYQYRGKCKHIDTANKMMANILGPDYSVVSLEDKDRGGAFDGLPEE